jgi:hypothetical protein
LQDEDETDESVDKQFSFEGVLVDQAHPRFAVVNGMLAGLKSCLTNWIQGGDYISKEDFQEVLTTEYMM